MPLVAASYVVNAFARCRHRSPEFSHLPKARFSKCGRFMYQILTILFWIRAKFEGWTSSFSSKGLPPAMLPSLWATF